MFTESSDNNMQFKSLFIKLLFAISFLLMPLLYAEDEEKPIPHGPLSMEWSSGDYVIYGAFVAAVVLFVISVMKKPDEIF